jgi:hypothetical protein
MTNKNTGDIPALKLRAREASHSIVVAGKHMKMCIVEVGETCRAAASPNNAASGAKFVSLFNRPWVSDQRKQEHIRKKEN